MSAIDNVFEQLATAGQTAFMPFVTAGDPDLDFTSELLQRLSDEGCHLVELGFPYSDPVADGPVIQESYTRALSGGVSVDQIFAMTAATAPKLKMPIVAMVSYAIIHRIGPELFIQRAIVAGIAGVIVPDLPLDESSDFARQCESNEFDLIQLITPTTPDERALKIAQTSTGFIYYVSIAGITGERASLPQTLQDRLRWLKENSTRPVCVGFGISQPQHAETLKPYADGVIVGSAIVKRISAAQDANNRQKVLDDISGFAQQMIGATS